MRVSKQIWYCYTRIRIGDPKSFQVDHRVPIYRGGTNDYDNLCLACPACNRLKGAEILLTNAQAKASAYREKQVALAHTRQEIQIRRIVADVNQEMDSKVMWLIANTD